ncbi:MAG: SPOR domain-containing protein [Gammaproteobacteria bacterium]|nr:SPOR domain-containing protein [Gammaproteobacteria bacterium]
MPADYKSMVHGHEKKPLPGFVWLLAGLAIGLFVALLVYLDKQPAIPADFGAAVQKELDKIKQKTSNASKEDKKAEKNSEQQEPKFNFYTILPELEVLIPDSETTPPRTTRNTPDKEGKQYILQAGSFKNMGDAEKLKASLALLGFQANIQKVTVNSTAWHRVRIGPYSQSNDLYDKIDELRRNNINAIPMEIKPE